MLMINRVRANIAILLGLAVLMPLFSAEMPATAQAALDKATADIAKVRVALVASLTKAQEAATKKGDLDGAMAVKEEIAKQTKLIGPVPATEEAYRKWVVGAWNVKGPGYTGVWTFDAKGGCTQGSTKGRWTLKGMEVKAQWDTGPCDGLTIPADLGATTTTGVADGGGVLSYVRRVE